VVAIGGGLPAGAKRAADSIVRSGIDAIVSFGLAGGLDPALPAGTLVIPAALRLANGQTVQADSSLVTRLGGPTHRLMLSAEAPVAISAEKAALFSETGAVALDLESGAVADAARFRRLPWAMVRAICDPAGRDLPEAALIGFDPYAGRVAPLRLFRSILRRPAQIAALMRLARDAGAAQRALARFRLAS